MEERSYFAIAAAVGLMQTVEAGVVLSRNGRLNASMCLPSAIEATWFGVTVLTLWNGSVSGGRVPWLWAFLAYYAIYAVIGSTTMSKGKGFDPETDSPTRALEELRLPKPIVLASLAFTIPYTVGSFLAFRSL